MTTIEERIRYFTDAATRSRTNIRMSDIHYTQLDVPRHMLQQSADGRPHLSYYAEHTSFCWSGNPMEPVEVSYGGAGEPVTALIEMPVEPARATLEEHADLFRTVCDQYLREVPS